MCTRSGQLVVELDAVSNAAWQSSFIQVRVALWLLHLYVIADHWLELFYGVSSVILFSLPDLKATGRTISRSLVVSQWDSNSGTMAWHIRPLHMLRQMYHVSQFGHWNQVKADSGQNSYMYCFSKRYIVTNGNLHIHSSGDPGAITMTSLESNFYMVISFGR